MVLGICSVLNIFKNILIKDTHQGKTWSWVFSGIKYPLSQPKAPPITFFLSMNEHKVLLSYPCLKKYRLRERDATIPHNWETEKSWCEWRSVSSEVCVMRQFFWGHGGFMDGQVPFHIMARAMRDTWVNCTFCGFFQPFPVHRNDFLLLLL